DLSDTLQPIVFRQYEQELSKVLGDLYARLNSQLAAAGFHADLRRTGVSDSAPSARAPAPPTAPQPVGETVEHVPYVPPQAAANAGIDLFRVSAEARVNHQRLRDQLHGWREHARAAGSDQSLEGGQPSAMGQRRPLRAEEVLSVAALVQRDGARRFDAALSGEGELRAAIREQLFEGARNLGLDTDQTCLAEHDEDAIDLVGLMFESLLETH